MDESLSIDQDLAKRLLVEGATVVILNLPLETEFGIDLKSWHTGKRFKGIKMIPPGVHIIYYNGTNKYGETAPRMSFFHNFKKSEFLVKKWDPDLEEVTSEGITEEEVNRLKENLQQLDPFLGPYPFQIWNKWRALSNKITEELLQRVNPECGVIRAALDLVSVEGEEQRLRKGKGGGAECSGAEARDKEEASGSGGVRKRLRSEEELLPRLRPVEGTELRFTPVPSNCFPEGSTPAEVTRHSLDLSFTLETLISKMRQADELVGELQMSFVCFLIGLSLESLDHWKELVNVICRSEQAMTKRRPLYVAILSTLEAQLQHVPEDFLVDIVKSENIIYLSLKEFFRTMLTSDSVEGRLRSAALRFQHTITDKFGWEFKHLDLDDDEDAPVIVSIEDV